MNIYNCSNPNLIKPKKVFINDTKFVKEGKNLAPLHYAIGPPWRDRSWTMSKEKNPVWAREWWNNGYKRTTVVRLIICYNVNKLYKFPDVKLRTTKSLLYNSCLTLSSPLDNVHLSVRSGCVRYNGDSVEKSLI